MIQLLGAASPIISALFKTVDKVVDSKEEKDRIKAKIQEQALAGEMKEISKLDCSFVASITYDDCYYNYSKQLFNSSVCKCSFWLWHTIRFTRCAMDLTNYRSWRLYAW